MSAAPFFLIAPGYPGLALKPIPAPIEVAEKYTDAELYRLIVAHALTTGTVRNKAEFDAQARQFGNLTAADELIEFRNRRFGCKAWRHGSSMVCECGVTWKVDAVDPPQCKPE